MSKFHQLMLLWRDGGDSVTDFFVSGWRTAQREVVSVCIPWMFSVYAVRMWIFETMMSNTCSTISPIAREAEWKGGLLVFLRAMQVHTIASYKNFFAIFWMLPILNWMRVVPTCSSGYQLSWNLHTACPQKSIR
jgi:hypothetical protein